MLIGILALQGDFDAHGRMLERLGFVAESAPAAERAWRMVKHPADLEGLNGLILPGGESGTMLKLLQPDDFWERLRVFVNSRPAFGTCAGAILLAREVTQPSQPGLGAIDMRVVRNAYGRQIDSSIRSAEVAPAWREALGGEALEAVLIRAPQFEHCGPEVEVMATQAGRPVLVRQGRALAASFHPELTTDTRVHAAFVAGIEAAETMK